LGDGNGYSHSTEPLNDEGQNCRQPPVEGNAATYEKIFELLAELLAKKVPPCPAWMNTKIYRIIYNSNLIT